MWTMASATVPTRRRVRPVCRAPPPPPVPRSISSRRSRQVRGTKSAQLATLLPGLPRLFNLSFTNSGTIPATNLVMADPVDPTSPSSIFRDAGLFGLVLPATPAGGVAEIYDPDAGGYVPYNEADTALLERSLGFRVTVPSVPAGATYAMSFNVRLREGTTQPGDTLQNCAGITTSTETAPQFCSQQLTVIEPSAERVAAEAGQPGQLHPPAGRSPARRPCSSSTGCPEHRHAVPASQLQVTDTDADFFDAVDLTGTVRVNYPARRQPRPCRRLHRRLRCRRLRRTAPRSTTAQTPPLPAGVALADIRGIRVTFSARPVATPNDPADVYRITPGTNFPTGGACTLASVCVDVKPRADLHSAPGTPTPAAAQRHGDRRVRVAPTGPGHAGTDPGVDRDAPR